MNTIESIEHNIQSLRATLASYTAFCSEQNIEENECIRTIKKTIMELEKQKIKLQNSLTISCEKTAY
jgi:DNA repair exonuclease SbcCD ATPase subunit